MAADRAIAEVARGQHCVVALAQLSAAGLSRAAIRHRLAHGWLRRLHRGVFLVGPAEPPLARAMAAVLACGEGAVLSHRPAAVLWGLSPPPMPAPRVIVVGRHRDGPPGVRTHRVVALHPADGARHQRIPVTSPARTLLDLAAAIGERELRRAVDEAHALRLVTRHSLDVQFERYPRHRGRANLERATRTDPAFTRSEAERRLLELVRAAGLPAPAVNARVGPYEVDFLWREQRLVVEVDGYAFHSSRAAFERDRRRDAELQAVGLRVMRVTWRRLADEPEVVVAMLARATAPTASAGAGRRRRPRPAGGAGRAG